MASALYDSILEKGEAWGKAQGKAAGKAQAQADTIIRILIDRMGWIDPAARDRIRGLSDADTLAAWYDNALLVSDADDARRLLDGIQKAPQHSRLMASTLHDSILEEDDARGAAGAEAHGEARCKVETIIRILIHRMGWVDPVVRERIRGLSDIDTLESSYEDALRVIDAEDARRLLDKIQKAVA